ncbi:MAG: hypothetical protein ACREVK_09480, partial [Gammaproteobacteria bacterium]
VKAALGIAIASMARTVPSAAIVGPLPPDLPKAYRVAPCRAADDPLRPPFVGKVAYEQIAVLPDLKRRERFIVIGFLSDLRH